MKKIQELYTTSDNEKERSAAEIAIEMVAVSKFYQTKMVKAINDVTLRIKCGECVTITGPSGSGKSTLLRLIASLDQPTQGQIVVDGVPLAGLSGDALAAFRRVHVGMIFQGFRLLPALTVLENVMAPLLPYTAAKPLRAQALEMLARVRLAPRASHLPGELSGGEQQRVAIARALVANPRVLLADEPTGSLDTETAHAIMSLLQDVQAETAMTLLVVTHDARIAARAQYRIQMEDGCLKEDIG